MILNNRQDAKSAKFLRFLGGLGDLAVEKARYPYVQYPLDYYRFSLIYANICIRRIFLEKLARIGVIRGCYTGRTVKFL